MLMVSVVCGLLFACVTVLFWQLVTREALKELRVGELRVQRTLFGLRIEHAGEWRTVRGPRWMHEGIEVQWPDLRGPALVRVLETEVRGGRVTGRILGSWAISCLAGSLVLAAFYLLGSLVFWLDRVEVGGRVLGSKLVFVGEFGTPGPIVDCDLMPFGGHAVTSFGEHLLAFDTGMEVTMLSPIGRKSLGLPTPRGVIGPSLLTAVGFGGGRANPIKGLVLGGARWCGAPFPEQFVHVSPPAVDGLVGFLGLSSLGGVFTVLDLSKGRLTTVRTLDEVEALQPWVRRQEPLRWEGRLVFDGIHAGTPVRVSIDTGAFGTSSRPGLPGLLPPLESEAAVTVSNYSRGAQGVVMPSIVKRLAPFCVAESCFDGVLVPTHRMSDGVDINVGLDLLWGRVLVVDATAGRLWIGTRGAIPPGAELANEALEELIRKAG